MLRHRSPARASSRRTSSALQAIADICTHACGQLATPKDSLCSASAATASARASTYSMLWWIVRNLINVPVAFENLAAAGGSSSGHPAKRCHLESGRSGTRVGENGLMRPCLSLNPPAELTGDRAG
jgi:hypothetical protein